MLNVAAWFIPALFLLNIVYLLLRKVMCKLKLWNDTIMFVLFAILSLVCGNICKNQTIPLYMIPILRTGFSIFFYHFGYYYKLHLEEKLKIKTEIYFAILVIIEVILIKYGGNINYHLYSMNFKEENIICIFLAGITGILFWVKIAEISVPILSKNKLVNLIGNNTFDIAIHHMFFVLLFNIIIYKLKDILPITGFNVQSFKKSIYYFYTPNLYQFKIFYVFIALSGPMLIRVILKKIKKIFKKEEKRLMLKVGKEEN